MTIQAPMKSWICIRCGYTCDGVEPPQYCPICQASADDFVEDTPENREKLAHVLADKY